MNLNKMLNLTGMVALVTGGGNGIGCGSARILAEAGADVVIGDVNLAAAEEVAEDIRDEGGGFDEFRGTSHRGVW